jgi:glucose-6-phosphate isomerase
MEELLFLRRIAHYEQDMDAAKYAEQINNNWFSGHNALRVYKQFIDLDKDQNGERMC